ncbi:MAG: thermonuclease family protein [Cyclobacteriaceae bacterium]|nr:thermonuclease family protein [Cyclobacteriaceae bacterium]
MTKVIDGNTLEILTESNETFEVMFKDVDSPELGQLFGDEAKEFTKKLLLKKKVTVEMKGKDMWGNRLAGITLKNGNNAEVELLKAGYAWHNILKSTNNELPVIEQNSKEKRIGLWASDNPTAPWVYRRKQSMSIAKSR